MDENFRFIVDDLDIVYDLNNVREYNLQGVNREKVIAEAFGYFTREDLEDRELLEKVLGTLALLPGMANRIVEKRLELSEMILGVGEVELFEDFLRVFVPNGKCEELIRESRIEDQKKKRMIEVFGKWNCEEAN